MSLLNLSNLHVVYMIISAFVMAWLILALGSVRIMLLIMSLLALIILISAFMGSSKSNIISGLHKAYMFISAFILIWLFIVILLDNETLVASTLFGSYNHVIFLIVLFMIFLLYMINK